MIDFMRKDLENDMAYTNIKIAARKLLKAQGRDFDAEFKKWRSRPLPEIAYLTVDATYYKVRIDGVVRDCATLIAIGTRREDGKRMILGVSCALSEAEVHWRQLVLLLLDVEAHDHRVGQAGH